MASDLTMNPSALRTGWKTRTAEKGVESSSKPPSRGRGRSSGQAGRGSGRGPGAFVDAFSGFGLSAVDAEDAESTEMPDEASFRCPFYCPFYRRLFEHANCSSFRPQAYAN
eukprot:6193449-Pleurochrysis_carterae.AAC.2